MFFDNIEMIPQIARRCNTAIFVVPSNLDIAIKGALTVGLQEKTVITIDQIKELLAKINLCQINDQYVVIRPAERLSEEAANAILKNLEEPNEKVHYVLVTDTLSALLPTILSRAAIYFLRLDYDLNAPIIADEKQKTLAKQLLVAKPTDLVRLAEEITKRKINTRQYALEIVRIAIEMLYKSYFLTGKKAVLLKMTKFLNLYGNLAANGHIKLHLVADLC